MSATNKTTNYELPIFVSTDKPAWLVDWNGAMNDIDTAVKAAHTAADNAQTTANTATSDISTLSGSVSTLTTSVSTLSTQTSTNTGSINTITSLIGNGEPTTQDKTLIGAINELAVEITSETAADVSYDNTDSGLTATDVQAAIDELATASPATPSAANVSYNNTTSGLTADDVQEAIDELAAAGGVITYSTNEVDTGNKWIDGKPIYRKALHTSSLTDNTIIDATVKIDYIDTLINMPLYYRTQTEASAIPRIQASNVMSVFVDSNGIRLSNPTTISSGAIDGFVEYTKATTP